MWDRVVIKRLPVGLQRRPPTVGSKLNGDRSFDAILELLSRNPLQQSHSGVGRERFSGGWREFAFFARDGQFRVEQPPGKLDLIVGQKWALETRSTGAAKRLSRGVALTYMLPPLLHHFPYDPDYFRRWLATDRSLVVDSLRDVTFLSRDCWRIECPALTEGHVTMTVDSQTGVVLELRNRAGVLAEWTSYITEAPPLELFDTAVL